MAKYQIRQLSDNKVVHTYESDSPQNHGGPWGNSSLYANESQPQSDQDQSARDEMWAKIRNQRDAKMKSDVDEARNYMLWAEAAGSAWDSQKKSDWADYRQDLCDVPSDIQAQIDDVGDPLNDIKDLDLDNYVWPTKPAL